MRTLPTHGKHVRPKQRRLRVGGFTAWLAKSCRGLTWPRFALFCLIVGFIALFQLSSLVSLGLVDRFPHMPRGLAGLARTFATTLLAFLPVLLAVVVVENRRPRQGAARIACLAAAVVLGQAVGMVLHVAAIGLLYPDGFFSSRVGLFSLPPGPLRKLSSQGIRFLAISLAATALYYYLRRAAELAGKVHREQVEHEETRRENAEARVQVMQAQIEPHFLFNTLAIVRRLYQTDRGSGRAMLDHLTRYLTASLPGMREARSTLGRELEFALAYLHVQKVRMESRLTFEVDVPDGLRRAPLPPMMLNTLVENAVIHGLSPLPAGGCIRITAAGGDGTLVVRVEDNGRGLQDTWGGGVGLANIRSRLQSAFGAAARLRLMQRDAGGVVATLELPLAVSEPIA
jgi:signal transduction histidine kinase